jgi:hypothetical protein
VIGNVSQPPKRLCSDGRTTNVLPLPEPSLHSELQLIVPKLTDTSERDGTAKMDDLTCMSLRLRGTGW